MWGGIVQVHYIVCVCVVHDVCIILGSSFSVCSLFLLCDDVKKDCYIYFITTNTTMGYALFELNHGYMLRSGQHISTDTTFKGVKQFTQQAVWNLLDVHNTILEHRIEQMHYSNKHRKPGVEYQIDDLVYLSMKNLTLGGCL